MTEQKNLVPHVLVTKFAGVYEGKELQKNPGITEDRFEAFRLPSLMNGQRVYPRGGDAQKK